MYLNIYSGSLHAKRRGLAKTLLVMNLTAIFLVSACLAASASGFSQKITLNEENVPIQKIFKEIFRQSGYQFVFTDQTLQGSKPVTVHVRDATLEDVLRICFQQQPFTFTISDGAIVVTQKTTAALQHSDSSLTSPPPGDIHGRVTTVQGVPLSGANIIIQRTKKGTQTNVKGEFILKNVRPNDTLLVSYIGYKTFKVAVGGGTDFPLVMKEATDELDKVVIQAYGTTTQRLTTSDIGTVTSTEIERQPVLNPLLAMQGRVAGLSVTQINGYASAPVKVELRGRGTIDSKFTSDPLYIIDGVPLTVLEVGGNSNYQNGSTGFIQNAYLGPAGGQSPLFSINPSDIESIEVLKDADATAIYGSRGANGVILIRTKKGKTGRTSFDLHIYEGVSKATRFYNLLNTPQYTALRREAFRNDGLIPTTGSAYDLLSWDTTHYTDWQKALYGRSANTIDIQGSLSGGDANNQFRIGAGYNNSTSILTVDGADKKASVSFSVTHKSNDQKFGVTLSGFYAYSQSDMIALPGVFLLPPNAPAIYDSIGNLNYSGWGGKDQNSYGRQAYPFAGLKQPYTAKTGLLNSSLILSYEVIKGLLFSATIGYNNAQANQQNFVLIASQDPFANPTGSSNLGYNSNKNWIIEPQATYNTLIGKGKLTALLGATAQQANTDGIYVNGNGYTSDALIKTISNAQQQYTTDNYGEYKYAALFGNLGYTWENKYIVRLSGRRDGSSRFGSGKQYGNFWSVGAAWIFTEEDWVKEHLSFISFGKFRGSYGTTGSDGVGDYQYLTRWNSNGTIPYNGIPALIPTQHANPNFQWQVNTKLEGAIDLGFFQDRIHMQVDYYQGRVGNQLVSFPIPMFTGFNNVTANSPALVENQGWEFIADLKIIHTKDFDWSAHFNMAINKNKLVAYPNFSQSPYVGKLIVGQPLSLVRVLHATGVDPLNGHYTFADKNHDGRITYDYSGQFSDDTYWHDLNPQYFGGLGMDFKYKSLSMNLYFIFRKQTGINNVFSSNIPGTIYNQSTDALGRWQKPGDLTSVAAFTTQPGDSYGNYRQLSDGAYSDASFIRLNNLSINYQLPDDFIKKIGMHGCGIFLHAQNLFVITKYKGIDPETQNFGSLPPPKTIVGGIHFDF